MAGSSLLLRSSLVFLLCGTAVVCCFQPPAQRVLASFEKKSEQSHFRRQPTIDPLSSSPRPRLLFSSVPNGDVDVNGAGQSSASSTNNNGSEVDNDAVSASNSEVGNNGNDDTLLFRSASYDTLHAAFVGVFTGLSVAVFKKSIEAVRALCYQSNRRIVSTNRIALIPAFGGLMVALLMTLGAFQPGLRGVVKKVDKASSSSRVAGIGERIRSLIDSMRKSVASAFTLGTGCSLGPEGPCVEIGMSVSRSLMDTSPNRLKQKADRIEWNHRLLSCGAAAGVAAGFNAPIAGVFFALEVLQDAFDSSSPNEYDAATANKAVTGTARIAPILTASVFSALVAHSILGDHFVFHLASYSLRTPLVELPLYILLGFVSGGVAFAFSRLARFFQAVFDGDIGGKWFKKLAKKSPKALKPIIGGLFCGVVGIFYPQIRFFGAETQNALLSNNALPNLMLLSLLSVKMIATAFSVASGLVGGTFAPCLFLGSMTGALFHNSVTFISESVLPQYAALSGLALADLPAYCMIGAASVLAALFRAPLTASLLLFEMTRDYDVILPLMVSAGFGSVVGDILDNKSKRVRKPKKLVPPLVDVAQQFERIKERKRLRRDKDHVSWGDLADPWEEEQEKEEQQ